MSFKAILCIFVAVIAMAAPFASKWLPNTLDRNPAAQHPTETMTAIVYKQHGDANVLEYTSVPKPVPKSNQYLIRVEASALNPVDFKLRRNTKVPEFLIPLPKIPGNDMAGVVVETPKNNPKFQVGDRVAAMMPIISQWGSHAEYAAVDESFLAKIPDSVDFVQAATYPLVGLTVLQNLANLNKPPQPGDKILIHSGAGGVGTFAIQYAASLQLKVATTASAPKADFLKELGADVVVDYKNQKFEEILEGYDIALDPMSWLYEERTLKSGVLKPNGHYLNVPSSDWNFGDGFENANGFRTYVNVVSSKIRNLFRPGSTPKYGLVFVDPKGEDMERVLGLIASGAIKPIIDRKYHISKAAEAYRYLEEGHATGKVVLYHGKEQEEQELVEEEAASDPGLESKKEMQETAPDTKPETELQKEKENDELRTEDERLQEEQE